MLCLHSFIPLLILPFAFISPANAQTQTPTYGVQNNIPSLNARLAEADDLLAFLQSHRERLYTSQYSGVLAALTQLGDSRALPFIEDYFHSTHLALDDLYSNDRDIADDRSKMEQLYWPLRWRGTTLQQKVTSFQSWAALLNEEERGYHPIIPLIGGIDEAIAAQGDAALPLLRQCALRFNPDRFGYSHIITAISLVNTPAALQTLRDLSHSYRTWDGGNQKNGHVARLALIRKGDKTAVQEELAYLVDALKRGDTKSLTSQTDDLLYEVRDLVAAGADKAPLEVAVQPYVAQGNSTAIYALKACGSEKSVDLILSLFNRPEILEAERGYERSNLLVTLAIIGQRVPEKVLPLITIWANDPNPWKRKSAQFAQDILQKQTPRY